MEVIVVLVLGAVVVGAVVVGLGSAMSRRRTADQLESERGASGRESGGPVRDRPAGPGAESQAPRAGGGAMHPPEQEGEASMPSEASHDSDEDSRS